jgi:hypothetical protein
LQEGTVLSQTVGMLQTSVSASYTYVILLLSSLVGEGFAFHLETVSQYLTHSNRLTTIHTGKSLQNIHYTYVFKKVFIRKQVKSVTFLH